MQSKKKTSTEKAKPQSELIRDFREDFVFYHRDSGLARKNHPLQEAARTLRARGDGVME
jgi:hypothetical protein